MISGLGRWLRFVALLGVLGGQAWAAVPPEILGLAMQPPVVNIAPGAEYSDAQRDYAMTIGLERTQKGRLWAAWVGGGDSDKGYFVAASSDDEGRTWSPPRLVIDPPDVPNGLRRRILVGNFWCDPTGKLWLFFDQSMGYFDGRAGAWAITCDNPDAANPVWSAPRRLWHGATLNKPTVLANGDWLMPIALWTRDRIGPKELREGFRELDEWRMANWFVSTDKGTTWTRRGGVVVPQSDFDEHMTVELKDGRLWMLARTKYGIAETFSPDGGRTWTEPKASVIQNPSARFFLRRLASGRILLVKNGPLDQRTGRTQMSAFLSEDEGKSWQGGLVFEERNGVSYPDGFQAPDGRIFISYDRERAKEREILMAVFTEADVLAGKAVSPEARLKVLISKALGPLKTVSSQAPTNSDTKVSLLTSAATTQRVKVFFDTDMMTDCDDAGAMAVLHALADLGECEILATVASVGDPKSIATVDVINRYYGRPGLPLGVVKSGGVQQKSLFTARVAAEFPHGVKSGEEIADATQVYREVLEKQPDQSVVILTVGYLTNLKNLLQLPASDGHLSGPDLVRRKVKTWVCMGGNFIGLPPKDDLKLGNVNFQRDAVSALAVVQQWPGPVVFAGREVCSVPSGLAIGASLAKTPTNNPVRRAYEHYFGGTAKSRHVADLATVLYAVRGLRDYWNLSEPGRMDLQAGMTFEWKFAAEGSQRYLLKRQRDGQPNDRYVEAVLDELLVQAPRAAKP